MKFHKGSTCSIKKDTNRIVSISNVSWDGIKNGSFIRLASEDYFYQITKIDKFSYSKAFTVLNGSGQIRVSGDVGIDIFQGDSVKLFYDEFELLAITNIKGGQNYKVGDEVRIEDGVPVLDKIENKQLFTSFKVSEVGEAGKITKVSVLSRGLYYLAPKTGIIVGGSGSGAEIEAEFDVIGKKKYIEATIRTVYNQPTSSILFLDVVLPDGFTNGVLSMEKSELFINSEYKGETQVGIQYNIYSDFTPTLSLPLLTRNSEDNIVLINQAFSKIDAAIGSIYSKLETINQKV